MKGLECSLITFEQGLMRVNYVIYKRRTKEAFALLGATKDLTNIIILYSKLDDHRDTFIAVENEKEVK